MLNYLSANWIYPIYSAPIKNGVLSLNDDGEIVKLFNAEEAKALKNVSHYNGILVPGFVNTHCHLELSHLKDKISEHTGLPGFIKQILALREHPEEVILSAMKKADEAMYENGIIAVGDISNLAISKLIKQQSKIYYHTFIEVFGFNRPAEPIINQALTLKNQFAPLKASIVPHAPYSVSSALFTEIKKVTQDDDSISIHNQETESENELFEIGKGKFADFFTDMGIAQNEAHGSGKNSIHYHLPQLPKNVNTLLVHNTFVSKADIDFAKQEHQKLFWCLCPNANKYIEDTLPDIALLEKEGLKITLGTDSLASNHQLDILSEMRTLQDYKNIPFQQSIKWATLNGAQFFGIEEQFGSFETGKKPGVILISNADGGKLSSDTTIKRLF